MAGDEHPAGSSLEAAIVILASESGEGVREEYRHLARLFGRLLSNWYPVGQVLISRDGRTYDQIDVQVGRNIRRVYFDITSFMPR